MAKAKQSKSKKPNPVIGATIVEVRPLTSDERHEQCWHGWRNGVAVVLSTGAVLIPMSDEEGNAPGELMCKHDGEFNIFGDEPPVKA